MYERYTLILDTPDGPLGSVALRLLDLGIDSLYANDIDEGTLMAREQQARIGAVLIPSATPPIDVKRVLLQICPKLGAGSQTLVMMGSRPDDQVCEQLRSWGAKWCLWEPFEQSALRFVMAAAMATGHRGDPRQDLRIPAPLEATLEIDGERTKLALHNLSATGAYLRHPSSPPPGTKVCVELPLPEGTIETRATVMNVKTTPSAERDDIPPGIGVHFDELDFEAERLLRGYIADWLSQFWL